MSKNQDSNNNNNHDDKTHKLELIRRALAIKHKLKVFESMTLPEAHEELALLMLTKWEYEDELKAIEELISESRAKNIAAKKSQAGALMSV